MATKFTLRDTFHTDETTYWEKIFFNPAYNEQLYLKELHFLAYSLVDKKDDADGSFTKRTNISPPMDAPAVVKKVIGDSISYIEEGRFDAKTRRWSYKMLPSKMADKFTSKGELWVEKKGDKIIERVCTVEIAASVFGVGGVIEGFIEKQTRDSYKVVATFTEKFIRDNNL